jgi:hypothetical protein
MSFEIAIVAIVVAAVAVAIFRRRTRATIAILAPRLGLLNLNGDRGREFMAGDKLALARLFAKSEESAGDPPQCDVLFLYCDVLADGRIGGTTASLRELIHRSGACVVVLAMDNSSDGFRAATKAAAVGRANLVLTMQRNGPAFVQFYQRLFEQMFGGATMPSAWIKLAPQVPGEDHPDCPAGIFLCERGPITFA